MFARGARPSAVGVKVWLRPVVMVSGATGIDQGWLPAVVGSEVAGEETAVVVRETALF